MHHSPSLPTAGRLFRRSAGGGRRKARRLKKVAAGFLDQVEDQASSSLGQHQWFFIWCIEFLPS